jgi:hypothetical protein
MSTGNPQFAKNVVVRGKNEIALKILCGLLGAVLLASMA